MGYALTMDEKSVKRGPFKYKLLSDKKEITVEVWHLKMHRLKIRSTKKIVFSCFLRTTTHHSGALK